MQTTDNSIYTTLWGKPKEDLWVSIWNKFHYIFSAVLNSNDKNKMQVLGKTLDLHETSNIIFSRNFNENSELSFVTLTFYIRIYAWNCYTQFLITMFLINSVFKFFLVCWMRNFAKFHYNINLKITSIQIVFKYSNYNSSSYTNKFTMEVSGSIMDRF